MSRNGRYRNRRNYRNRRTLSGYNIASRTSARNQSKQIYSLSRKVNYLTRLNRPEIKVEEGESTYSFNTNFTVPYGFFFNPQFDAIDGNFIRTRSLRLGGSLRYSDNYDEITINQGYIRSVSVRILIYQLRQATSSDSPSLANILQLDGNLAALDAYRPFNAGASQSCKILYNGIYTVSNEHPIVHFNISIPGRRLLNMSWLTNGASDADEPEFTVPKGAIAIYFIQSGLATGSTFNNIVSVDEFHKLAYTDS